MDNRIKTFILLIALTAIAILVGNLFGPSGLAIALAFVLAMNGAAYFFSHKIVLWMYKAEPAKESEYPKLYRMVREVATYAKIPMPKIYIIPSAQPNAFATGRNPENGIVAFTIGIMNLLNEEELKGVAAHEISHIKNRDILIQTVAAMIAGIIGFAGSMARWSMIFGSSDDGPNLVEMLVLAIIMPIAAVLIQLAISRSREYLADESAAKIVRNPEGLASALLKLEKGVEKEPMALGSPTTSSLFIQNPFSSRGMLRFLSTHPPIEDRVKKLRGMRF